MDSNRSDTSEGRADDGLASTWRQAPLLIPLAAAILGTTFMVWMDVLARA